MKILVCGDMDGHFRAENLINKTKILDLLKDFDGGDFWQNVVLGEHPDFARFGHSLKYEQWVNAIQAFCQRGYIEVIDVK